jgi:ankyrin repeat protein
MKRVILLFILVLTIFTCKKNSTKGISDIQEESEIDVITDLIRKDQVIQLKKIINNNNINSFNSEGLTPLLIASKERNYDIINYLIKSGADVNKSGEGQYEDMTPLVFTLKPIVHDEKKLYEIVNLLLKIMLILMLYRVIIKPLYI